MAESRHPGIRDIFAEVPETYELVNHLMTLGLDLRWRRRAADEAASTGGSRWLDVCTGTGDMAACLSRRAAPGTTVVAADFSLPMMRKALRRSFAGPVAFTAGAADALPFSDGSFDCVTSAFATRNINVSREALVASFREFRRVLRPGGVFVNLETSRPPARIVRSTLDLYARIVVSNLGAFISGSRAGYAYLSRTLRRFYGAEELSSIMRQAGFSRVSFRRATWGVVAIHRAVK
jgi:demethylmenaquinone methyltransferase/2-methoxy-6-polyprenyl-1,4-benzoquinol methylase